MIRSQSDHLRRRCLLQIPSRNYRRRHCWYLVLLAAMGLGFALTGLPAEAATPHFLPLEFLHKSWTEAEGRVLPPILSMGQGSDGYLWLGTGEGLIHFDGTRFVAWKPRDGERLPGRDIRFLVPSAGGFWVGTDAGVGRVERGRVIRYAQADQFLTGPVVGMVPGLAGELWVIGFSQGLTTLAVLRTDGSVRRYGAADGLPDARLFALHRQPSGGLWLGTDRGLCEWRPGSPAVFYGPSVRPLSIAEDAGGALLLIDGAKNILRFRDGVFETAVPGMESSGLSLRSLTRDGEGHIWVATVGQGLLRLRGDGMERFQRNDGLSGNVVTGVLEDRESNVWVSTDRGVDRFRDSSVTRISSGAGLASDTVNAVAGSADGSVWIGTAAGVNRDRDGEIAANSTFTGLPGTAVYALHSDPGGRLWAGTTGPAYWSGNRFAAVAAPGGAEWGLTFAIAGGPRGEVYAADSRMGLVAIRDGVASALVIPGVETKNIYRLAATRSGDLWIGLYNGGAAVLQHGEARFYTAQAGIAGGAVQAIYEDAQGSVWLGAKSGLSRLRAGVWTTWNSHQGLPDNIQSIIEDSAGGLWALAADGLLRLSQDELNGTPDGAPQALHPRRFGASSGLRLRHDSNMAGPHLYRARDGRLWIPTDDGVVIVAPDRIHGNPTAPAVVVEEMSMDGNPADLDAVEPLSIRGRDLSFTYTGISMAAPDGVRFKYHLDGLDQEGVWNDAGVRRNVDFVHLAPGHYLFHVIASNSDGVWNRTGASVSFEMLPYFYQTSWFAVVCAGAFGLLLWGLYRLQIRSVEYRFELAAQERSRVTRELHDSLLQGFSGVVWQLEAASRQFDTNPKVSHEKLDHAIEQADQALLETRNTLLSLRLPAIENCTLPEAITEAGRRLTEGMPPSFQCTVKGSVRLLGYKEQANLFLIGREAISNAVTHAKAHRIQAHLTYTNAEVQLVVRDDGTGFDATVMTRMENHWGLAGMQGRAAEIKAEFRLDTAPGQGTTVSVTVKNRRTIRPMRLLRKIRRGDRMSN